MKGKTKFIILLVVVLICSIFIWWRYFFVFGTGVKGGDLNHLEKKGVMFKTYEGRIIQEGFRANTPGSLASNEFDFSVDDESVAQVLEKSAGKFVEVRYKEYRNPIMWRGESRYIVIEVLNVKESNPIENTGIK